MQSPFRVRGIVEGFYGPPWTHAERLEAIAFLGAHDMNAYAYAPKDDAKHRHEWRTPYDADETKRFAALADAGRVEGVRIGFAISPGLDIDYESARDRASLLGKLRAMQDVGIDWFLLLLDDIPSRAGIAPHQAALVCELLAALRDAAPHASLTVCPTEYVGVRPSPYLTALASGLPSDVDVMWTGPTVCSPTITRADAIGRAAALGGRAPLIWDNYPVNDATMTASLHLGPYCGRDAQLAGVVAGVLCNPMPQVRASRVALATAAAWCSDPGAYDAERSWEAAVAEVGGERAADLRTLAAVCRDSALADPAASELARAVRCFGEATGEAFDAELRVLATTLRELRDAAGRWIEVATASGPEPEDHLGQLAAELAPWAMAARSEAAAGLAALRLAQKVCAVAADERIVPPDADAALQQAFAALFTWQSARASDKVVAGPRFAVYTAVVTRADGTQALDLSLALREDANAIDVLCRTALAGYERWRVAGRDDVRPVLHPPLPFHDVRLA